MRIPLIKAWRGWPVGRRSVRVGERDKAYRGLHPMDVQYLTPQDFCNGHGRPLSPTQQRRLFREYVQAALHLPVMSQHPSSLNGRRRPGVLCADLAFVRSAGFHGRSERHPDFLYGGREDVRPYEAEALLPTRPYGIPITSETFTPYWLDGVYIEDED